MRNLVIHIIKKWNSLSVIGTNSISRIIFTDQNLKIGWKEIF